MLVFRKTLKFEGENLCRYLLGYGVIRFFIEGMRTDQLQVKGVAVSQVLSAVLAVGALATIVVVRVMMWKKEKQQCEK
jgi:phosphatidylglycerol:prolipoprotein diacylglycerol transferase